MFAPIPRLREAGPGSEAPGGAARRLIALALFACALGAIAADAAAQIPNRPATGKPRILGSPTVPGLLEADIGPIEDRNGLPAKNWATMGPGRPAFNWYRYQWLHGNAEPEPCDFTRFGPKQLKQGEAVSYQLAPADAGETIRVAVCFRDLDQNVEMVVSDATSAIGADTRPPEFARGETSTGGGSVTLFFDEVLNPGADPMAEIDEKRPPATCDGSWLPRPSAFSVVVEGKKIYPGRGVTVEGCRRNWSTRPYIWPMDGRVTVHLGTTQLTNPGIRKGQAVRVVYTDPTSGDDRAALQDRTGNDVASFDVAVVNLSEKEPTDSDVTQEPKPKSAEVDGDGRGVLVTFDEALDPNRQPPPGAFTVRENNVALTVTSLSLDGAAGEVALGVYPRVRRGRTVTVSYARPGDGSELRDTDGVAVKSFSRYGVRNNSDIRPGLVPTVGEVFGTGVEMDLVFNKVLTANDVPASAFTVKADGAAITVGSVAISGGILFLRGLTPLVREDQSVTLSYAEPATGDLLEATDGSVADSFTDFSFIGNASVVGPQPVFSNALMLSPDAISLAYAGTLNAGVGVPAVSAFTVNVDGTPIGIGSVRIDTSDNAVVLSGLTPDLAKGNVVTVSYTRPTSGVVLQGTDGTPAESFADQEVLLTFPPVLVGARVLVDDATRLALEFDDVLWAHNFPPASAFSLTVNGSARAVTAAARGSASEREFVYLDFAAVARGDTVTVSYTQPSGVHQLRSGVALVESFSDYPVYNPSPPVPTGRTIVLHPTITVFIEFSSALAEPLPPASAFLVEAIYLDGTVLITDTVDVTPALETERTTLKLASGDAFGPNVTIKFTYTKPTTGDVLRGANGLAVASFNQGSVTGTGTEPDPPTAEFRDLPAGFHTGEAFTVGLAFSEEFPVTADQLRAGLTVTGGGLTALARAAAGEDRNWNLTLTPNSAADAVTVTLTPKENCDAPNAICTEDKRPLEAAVTATVPGREPTRVVSARLTSDPGANGTWDTGETVTAAIEFSRRVTVYGPPNVKPTLGITLDGTRREAALTSSGFTDTFAFSHAVTAADSGATTVVMVANGIALNGTILQDSDAEVVDDLTFPADTLSTGSTGSEPTLSVADATATEGAGATADFAVTLDAAAADTVTVDYATSDGTAKAGADYTATSGTLAFAPGDTAMTISVPVLDDAVEDDGETFTLTLSSASGASLGDSTATGTIRNTEAAPLTASFGDMPATHDGSAFTFGLAFSEEFSIGYATVQAAFDVTGGSATRAERRQQGSNLGWTITVEPASAADAVTITLPETTDCTASGAICTEDGRPLSHSLSATVGGETILPSVSVADASAAEGDAVAFTVSLSAASGQQVTVDYATAGGTAASGTDFTAASGTLAFAAGDTSKTVTVSTTDDSAEEEDETFTLTLSGASGASLGDASATGTIIDDDAGATPLTASFEGMPATHDGSAFTFGLSFSEEFSISYATVQAAFDVTGGSATRAERRQQGSNLGWTITVEPASAAGAVTITLPETTDCTAGGAICTEDGRPLSHSLSATVGGETILPSVSVADASATEGDAVAFTVSLSAASGQQVTVDYATAGGTAASGTDFTAASGTLTFAAGDVSKTVSVATTDDSAEEEDETFTLTLSGASGASLGDASATGTIVDDDDAGATPLTASFQDMPATHDGSAFTFGLSFSEEFPISYVTLRDSAFDVTGGSVTRAKRKQAGSNLGWTITVEPASANDTVTIALPETTDCTASGAICTEDGRPLSNSLSATVIDAASSTSGDRSGAGTGVALDDALALLGGVTPDDASAALFGEGGLSGTQLDALDRLGNRNGRYDLGDMLSWRDRCRRGEADCGTAPTDPSPASAALLAAPAVARGASGRPRRRRDAGRGGRSPVRGLRSRARMARDALAMLLAAVTAWSCTDGSLGPTAAADADPGFLTVEWRAPAASRAVGVLLELEGPGIETLRAPGLELYQSESPGRRQVILVGSPATGPLMQFRVPDRNRLPLYRVRVVQVTGEDYGLRDPGDYRAVITSN